MCNINLLAICRNRRRILHRQLRLAIATLPRNGSLRILLLFPLLIALLIIHNHLFFKIRLHVNAPVLISLRIAPKHIVISREDSI